MHTRFYFLFLLLAPARVAIIVAGVQKCAPSKQPRAQAGEQAPKGSAVQAGSAAVY